MKKVLLSALLLCASLWLVAQSSGTPDITAEQLKQVAKTDSSSAIKPTLGLTAGTSFMFTPGAGGALTHFVAPQLSWKLTPRFTLSTGVMLGFTSFDSYGSSSAETRALVPYARTPALQTTAYVAGEYKVNPKFSLTGRLFTDIARLDLSGEGQQVGVNTYGGAAGFKLKVGQRASIMAEIQIQRGNNPYPDIPNSNLSPQFFHRIGPWDANW